MAPKTAGLSLGRANSLIPSSEVVQRSRKALAKYSDLLVSSSLWTLNTFFPGPTRIRTIADPRRLNVLN